MQFLPTLPKDSIATGFRGFRYFLEIANGSLGETFTRLRQGFARGLFTEQPVQ